MSELDPRARGRLTLPALAARGPMLVSVVLGIAIAGQAAAIALSLSAEIAVGFGARSTEVIGPRTRAKREVPLEDITTAHLFGAAPQVMTAANTRAASRSPLVLTGIIATGDPHDGFAIVGTSVDTARLVHVGSEATPGAVLTEVYPKWVVLERGGERLRLQLPRKDLAGVYGGGGGGGDSGALLAREASVPAAPEGEEDGDSDGGGAFALPAYLSPPPLSNGAAVVRAFALRFSTVDGQRGERIGGTGLNGKVLAKLGLSPGDVIVQVNGVPVGANNAPNLMDVLQSGNGTLMVERDGEDTSVALDPGSVADAAALFRQADPDP